MKYKLLFSLLLVTLPMLAEAKAFVFPNGKIFEETISFHRTLSGVLVSVSEWREIIGVIKHANAAELSLRDLIENYTRTMASFYGINPIETLETNVCESDWNKRPEFAITAPGDNGKAYSVAQFHKPTFDTFSEMYKLHLDYKNPYHQIELSSLMLQDGYAFHWTCLF